MSLPTYALIALGGAIGTVGRAWLAAAMVSLTGASFPWGTVLINVLGSFVIGWFATLTASDGRFQVGADWRAFVMIGLCGGFTTFSSFSLQTLDLLRDGRPWSALGNVAMSVLLCISAAAAGYGVAHGMRMSRLAALALPEGERIGDSILVVLHDSATARRQLDAGTLLLGNGGGRIAALAIEAPIMDTRLPTEELLPRRTSGNDWAADLRAAFDAWQPTAEGIASRWIETGRDGAQAVLEHARRAHLVVLERRGDAGEPERLRAALSTSSRPVLLMPPQGGVPFGRTVAIGWSDTGSEAAAIEAARSLLARAERVVLVRIGAIPGSRPMSAAETLVRPDGALATLAQDADADLLVMGATLPAHRGGMTRQVLESAELPVLMRV